MRTPPIAGVRGAEWGQVARDAPAKLNLTLAILGRRPDGFHDLHSVMVAVGLADRLELRIAAGPVDTLTVVGPGGDPVSGDLGPPQDNLVLRGIGAARAALRATAVEAPLPALAARLEKRIPVAAGLGGGSSDGAAAIDGSLEAWGLATMLDPAARLAAAAALGSDVPFFLAGGWALVEGRGERVTPLPGVRGAAPWVLLVTPAVAASTAAVYAAYAAGVRPPAGASLATSSHLAAELARGLAAGRFLDRAGVLAASNDLAPATAALLPALGGLRRGLGRLLGRPVGQSGSGPTLWVLYPSEAAAREAADLVGREAADGSLEAPGDTPPFVVAAPIAGGRQP
ncbi:MAG: ispE [Chloroflexi bacterium]|nr:ispE [Chloroflexota bacterium]